MTTIELQDTWANFVRAYYLSCMFGTYSASGMRLVAAAPAMSENEAIGRAVMHLHPKWKPAASGTWHRRDEPPWSYPTNIANVMAAMNISHDVFGSAFSGSIAATTQHVPVFRNFFAHRNRDSQIAAQMLAPNYGVSATLRPSRILQSRALGRPQPILFDWIDDFVLLIQYLCG